MSFGKVEMKSILSVISGLVGIISLSLLLFFFYFSLHPSSRHLFIVWRFRILRKKMSRKQCVDCVVCGNEVIWIYDLFGLNYTEILIIERLNKYCHSNIVIIFVLISELCIACEKKCEAKFHSWISKQKQL